MIEFDVDCEQALGILSIGQEPPDGLEFTAYYRQERCKINILNAFVNDVKFLLLAEGMSQKHEISCAVDTTVSLDLHINNGCVFRGNQSLNNNLVDFSVPIFECLEIGDVEEDHLCWEAEIHEYFKALWIFCVLQ
jgi:hypothetical protein